MYLRQSDATIEPETEDVAWIISPSSSMFGAAPKTSRSGKMELRLTETGLRPVC